MAMGLGKIPGHSGTDFKRRQSTLFFSYFDQKNKKTFNKKVPDVEFKRTQTYRIFKSYSNDAPTRILHLLAIIIFTFVFLILFQRGYELFMHVSASKSESQKELIFYNHHIKDAIPLYLKEGDLYLLDGELDFAQYSYQRVLDMNRHHYRANLGLSNTLYQQCIEHHKYCEDAVAYIKYTKSLSKKHQRDLNRWLLEIRHSFR